MHHVAHEHLAGVLVQLLQVGMVDRRLDHLHLQHRVGGTRQRRDSTVTPALTGRSDAARRAGLRLTGQQDTFYHSHTQPQGLGNVCKVGGTGGGTTPTKGGHRQLLTSFFPCNAH